MRKKFSLRHFFRHPGKSFIHEVSSSRYGLSLVEVLVSAAVLAIFVVPFFHTMIATHRGTLLMEEDFTAILLGLELADQVKIIPLKYIEGFGRKSISAGSQPLIDYFKTTPLYNNLLAHPSELEKVLSLLTLSLSPIPEGYSLELEVEPKHGYFARMNVYVSYNFKGINNNSRSISRKISGILVGGN